MSTSAIYSQTDFPAVLKWQAIAFMRMEWSYIFTEDQDGKYVSETYPVEFQPVHFVVTEGDTLISYAATIRENIEHTNRSYKVCGLGNVFTFPPYRREGNGSKVVELATNTIKESEVDVAILFCDRLNAPFYAKAGWISTSSPTYITHSKNDHEIHDEQRMMLFISDKGKQGQRDFEQQPVYLDWTW